MPEQIVKYQRSTRVLHWIHTGAFLLLFITGLIIFIPAFGPAAAGGATRIVHRVGAILFVAIPILRFLMGPSSSLSGVLKAFVWDSGDIGWLKAAPRYYFLGDEKAMPPQGEMNSGQKLWWLITVVAWVVFTITGGIMWFGKETLGPSALTTMVLLHDIMMSIVIPMIFVHLYLGIIHPLMTEAWNSMWHGTVSAEYAKQHHAKWYQEIKGK
jgi:formate dehydrogenase subunit gamma